MSSIRGIIKRLKHIAILFCVKLSGPPRILAYTKELNADILRMFGAKVGKHKVRIHSPITLHEAENGYSNLTIEDGCILNGNNFLDLSSPLILEPPHYFNLLLGNIACAQADLLHTGVMIRDLPEK